MNTWNIYYIMIFMNYVKITIIMIVHINNKAAISIRLHSVTDNIIGSERHKKSFVEYTWTQIDAENEWESVFVYFKFTFKLIPYVDKLQRMILSNKMPWVLVELCLSHYIISKKYLLQGVMEAAEMSKFRNLKQKQLTSIKSQ